MGTNKRKTATMAKATKAKPATPAKSGGKIVKKAPAAKPKAPTKSKAAAAMTTRPKGGKAAATRKKAAPKKKVPGALKRKERFDEATTAEDEENERRVIDDGPDHDEDDTGGAVSEDEDNAKEKRARAAKGPDTRTPKEKAAAEKEARKRTNQKSRRRGYRVLARRAGYSPNPAYSTPDGSLDVAVPITTPGEAIRACKWRPKQTDKAAFGGLHEFEERSALAHESLPKSAARVLQAHGEQYLRRIVASTMESMVDRCQTKITPAMVLSATRKLRGVQKYSFVAPQGLVRFSQREAPELRTPMWAGEEDEVDGEKKLITMQQNMETLLAERAGLVKEGATLRESDPSFDAALKKKYDKVVAGIEKLREEAAEASFA